jgi:hypothetical protein
MKLYPGTQRKYQEQLDSVYDLPTNGTVTVNACLTVGRPHRVEVQSAKVSIKIEGAP